jgi:hypothetical protein
VAVNQTAGTNNLTAPAGGGQGGDFFIAKNANATVTLNAITQTGGWSNGITWGNLAAQTPGGTPAGGNVNANLTVSFDDRTPTISGFTPGGFNSIAAAANVVTLQVNGDGTTSATNNGNLAFPFINRSTGAANLGKLQVNYSGNWGANAFFISAGNIAMNNASGQTGAIGYNAGTGAVSLTSNATSPTYRLISTLGSVSTFTVDASNARCDFG